MPWQECSKVDQRLRFVARLLEGERMAELCREFEISRKTGYKIWNRYKHWKMRNSCNQILGALAVLQTSLSKSQLSPTKSEKGAISATREDPGVP